MKKYLLICILIIIPLCAYNQAINGTVLNQKDKKPIEFASIYFNGTFIGTYSDENGDFKLNIAQFVSSPLTISALGYYSVTLTEFSTDKPLVIYLNPKAYEIEGVVIKVKSSARERQKNLKLFKENFLGTSKNALSCIIANEDDITLISENDTLKAFSTKPVQIDNKRLGYKTSYYLDRFWYDRKRNSFFISGNMIYNEDLINDNTMKESYEERRRATYSGSRMHFFRALWENNLESAGFSMKESGNKFVDYDFNYNKYIIQTDSLTKRLIYNKKLGIIFHRDMTTSWITFLKDFVSFDISGYFDPFAVSWEGEMAKQRIADLLPYEYKSIK